MEKAETLKNRNASYSPLGSTALRASGIEFKDLGINDPNTHLDQYLKYGEHTLKFIEEDLITDCGERMVGTKFINKVGFRRLGSDLLSEKGNFSMRKITESTVQKMDELWAEPQLKARAEIEARLPDRLLEWLPEADIEEVLVEESVPLAEDESYAVSRLYRKLSDDDIEMSVIILHNPSISAFNQTRARLGVEAPLSDSALQLLENTYSLKPGNGSRFDELIRRYVDTYDSVLTDENSRQEFVFGLRRDRKKELPDSLQTIRRQKPLLNIYTDTIRALARSNWVASRELVSIDQKLGLGMGLEEGCTLGLEDSRAMLDGAQQFILATLNKASPDTLLKLESITLSDAAAAYVVAGHYGNEARNEGIRYENPACPAILSAQSLSEQTALQRAFRIEGDPTKCVQCPACKETVDLPKKLYEKKILHCVKCKASVHKDGRKVDKKIIEEYYRREKRPQNAEKESDWNRILREEKEKKDVLKEQREAERRTKQAA